MLHSIQHGLNANLCTLPHTKIHYNWAFFASAVRHNFYRNVNFSRRTKIDSDKRLRQLSQNKIPEASFSSEIAQRYCIDFKSQGLIYTQVQGLQLKFGTNKSYLKKNLELLSFKSEMINRNKKLILENLGISVFVFNLMSKSIQIII